MRITLTVVDGPHKGQLFTFSGHDTFLVGRSRRAHFQLPAKDKYFSRVHFLIEVNPPSCRIMDMGSRNGTHLNGKKVDTSDLKDGDQIRAGHTILRISFEKDSSEPKSELPPSFKVPEPEVVPVPLPPAPVPPSVTPLSVVVGVPFCPACDNPLPASAAICPACQALSKEQEQSIEGYQIIRILGQGAMGVVYLALRKADSLLVALKTIVPAVAGTHAQVQRFLREAEILKQLSHPNIVSFRDMGQTAGRIFFAMDYVRGKDAEQTLREQGPMKVPRAAGLVCQLLRGLDYAHQRGFVHRDIKPSNMLLANINGQEQVRLADFGLARVYQASQLSGLTMTGEIGGTIAFIAPEQITQYREARPPADQYAAAATLYNLLTAQYVYDLPRELSKQLGLILNENPIPIRNRRSDLPASLAAIIQKALARDPVDRHADVKAFLTALTPFAS
jgi:serine/threonine-protein kinase